ncbi:MAG: hypothetical protein ACOCV1_08655 [Bacillota bacterium]
MKKRTQEKIKEDIKNILKFGKELKSSHLMRKANICYTQLMVLIQEGFLSRKDCGKEKRIFLTDPVYQ